MNHGRAGTPEGTSKILDAIASLSLYRSSIVRHLGIVIGGRVESNLRFLGKRAEGWALVGRCAFSAGRS